MINYLAGGLVFGSAYAIAATGLVLTFKASRVFNFAHGALAYAFAVCYYELRVTHGWQSGVALAFTLAVVAPVVGALLSLVLFRYLRHTPVSVQVVSTIGLFVAIPAVLRVWLGDEPRFDAIGLFTGAPKIYDIAGARLNQDQVAVVVAAAVVAVLLAVLLRFTRFGLTVRAVVDSERLASLLGINPLLVDAGTGALSAVMAGVAGVLITPLLGLVESSFTVLLVASIAAVILGALRNIGWTFAGAIGIGLVQGLAGRYLPDSGIWAQGFRPSLPFFVIFGALVGYSLYLTVRHVPLVSEQRGLVGHVERRGGPVFRFGWSGTAVVALGLVPWLVSPLWVAIIASGVAVGVILLSYVLITGMGEMVSLCQVTFAGIGAVATAQLATVHGWPVLASVVVAGLIAMPLGLVIGLASLRLGSLYLALSTLGFALLVEGLVFTHDRFSNQGLGVRIGDPSFFGVDLGTDTRFYFVVLVAFGLAALLVANVRSSTSGLELSAVRSAEPAAAMLGVDNTGIKVAAFTLSAFIAAVGGGLLATGVGVAHPESFHAVIGLVWLAALVTFGVRRVTAALVGGLAIFAVPRLFSQYISLDWVEVPSVLFGLGAIVVARDPRGIIGTNAHYLLSLGDALRRRPPIDDAAGPPSGTAADDVASRSVQA